MLDRMAIFCRSLTRNAGRVRTNQMPKATTGDTVDIEAVRARFRPEQITTLFIGESAPKSGKFFYVGNTQMLGNMRRAVESAFGRTDNFLARFKGFGWYLDDLVLAPVDDLPPAQRKAQCRASRKSLADRIKDYRPDAVVSLLRRIETDVDVAVAMAGYNKARFAVPFPGMGTNFQDEMAAIIYQLPRL